MFRPPSLACRHPAPVVDTQMRFRHPAPVVNTPDTSLTSRTRCRHPAPIVDIPDVFSTLSTCCQHPPDTSSTSWTRFRHPAPVVNTPDVFSTTCVCPFPYVFDTPDPVFDPVLKLGHIKDIWCFFEWHLVYSRYLLCCNNHL
jgi:hypothetical protein